MDRKLLPIFVAIGLVPYLALFAIATTLLSTKQPIFNWIMESVFGDNALYLIGAMGLYCLLIVVLSIVCFFVSVNKDRDALASAKFAMVLKITQVPAYLCIAVLVVLFVISIFTIAFSVGLVAIVCLSMFATGLFVLSSVIAAIKNQIFAFREAVWIILLQFVFFADVISSIVFYTKLKRMRIGSAE